MTITTDISVHDNGFPGLGSRLLMVLGSAFHAWRRRSLSARELARQLDRMDAHLLADVGLVRRTRQIGWALAPRGSDPTPVFSSTYEAGEAQ